MLVEGIDDEDSKRPVAPETFPPPASPRGATAPLGSPARFRAPDGDGNMMTMLEASFWDPLFVKACSSNGFFDVNFWFNSTLTFQASEVLLC